jgi:histidinol phosphatase-like PHP family hydrolase
MNGKLKLDLHTHLLEAVNFARADRKLVYEIVKKAQMKGLDGLAITDHEELGMSFAYEVKQISEDIFGNKFIVIPGREIHKGIEHIVELYFENNCVFRFIAHPLSFSAEDYKNLGVVHGIEIENGSFYIDEKKISGYAEKYRLLKLKNSDAHSLVGIGKCYNEIGLDELCYHLRREPK